MAVSVKRITIWSVSVADRPGLLGRVLEPLAKAKVDVQVVMGYKLPGEGGSATIEVAPVTGKAVKAAQAAGFAPSPLPALLVSGDNRPGLGYAIGGALGQAGISMHYLMTQVVGRKFSSVMGFGSEDEAKRAAPLIKKATAR